MDTELRTLFKRLPVADFEGDWETVVSGITTDSRRVVPHFIFFALEGSRTDGNLFIEEAIDRGAGAIVSENPPGRHGKVAFLKVENIRSVLAEIARRFHGNPEKDLDLIGITGTNGKTTVAFLMKHILEKAGKRAGMLGTVTYDLGHRTLPAYRTTPEAVEIYALLRQIADSGCEYGIMEVSSHGIEQERVDRLPFKAAAFLNLTRDHIDYHKTMENYFAEKRRLFDGGLGSLPEISVLNLDDPYGRRLREEAGHGIEFLTFGEDPEADLSASRIELTPEGSRFLLHWRKGRFPVKTALPGRYNVSNILAALSIAAGLGLDLEDLISALEDFPGVPGRMERVEAGQPFSVFVDYAHTDDALKNALSMLRPITPGRLLVVFGCGGNRDRLKRPLMTRVVMDLCDLAWATSDNPRKESVALIFEDMKRGVTDEERIRFVENRRRAISLALDEARPDDCLLIAGKGHETFQEFHDSIVPFDDRRVAQELLAIKHPY